MSYTSSTLVGQEFKDITFGAGTAISTTKLAQYITDADAEIDSRLGVKYTVPITGTQALAMCGMIATWIVKHRVLDVIKVKTGEDKTSQGNVKTYRQQALDMLNDIASGKVILKDATLATAADGVRSYTNDHSTENVFQSGVDQW